MTRRAALQSGWFDHAEAAVVLAELGRLRAVLEAVLVAERASAAVATEVWSGGARDRVDRILADHWATVRQLDGALRDYGRSVMGALHGPIVEHRGAAVGASRPARVDPDAGR